MSLRLTDDFDVLVGDDHYSELDELLDEFDQEVPSLLMKLINEFREMRDRDIEPPTSLMSVSSGQYRLEMKHENTYGLVLEKNDKSKDPIRVTVSLDPKTSRAKIAYGAVVERVEYKNVYSVEGLVRRALDFQLRVDDFSSSISPFCRF